MLLEIRNFISVLNLWSMKRIYWSVGVSKGLLKKAKYINILFGYTIKYLCTLLKYTFAKKNVNIGIFCYTIWFKMIS